MANIETAEGTKGQGFKIPDRPLNLDEELTSAKLAERGRNLYARRNERNEHAVLSNRETNRELKNVQFQEDAETRVAKEGIETALGVLMPSTFLAKGASKAAKVANKVGNVVADKALDSVVSKVVDKSVDWIKEKALTRRSADDIRNGPQGGYADHTPADTKEQQQIIAMYMASLEEKAEAKLRKTAFETGNDPEEYLKEAKKKSYSPSIPGSSYQHGNYRYNDPEYDKMKNEAGWAYEALSGKMGDEKLVERVKELTKKNIEDAAKNDTYVAEKKQQRAEAQARENQFTERMENIEKNSKKISELNGWDAETREHLQKTMVRTTDILHEKHANNHVASDEHMAELAKIDERMAKIANKLEGMDQSERVTTLRQSMGQDKVKNPELLAQIHEEMKDPERAIAPLPDRPRDPVAAAPGAPATSPSAPGAAPGEVAAAPKADTPASPSAPAPSATPPAASADSSSAVTAAPKAGTESPSVAPAPRPSSSATGADRVASAPDASATPQPANKQNEKRSADAQHPSAAGQGGDYAKAKEGFDFLDNLRRNGQLDIRTGKISGSEGKDSAFLAKAADHMRNFNSYYKQHGEKSEVHASIQAYNDRFAKSWDAEAKRLQAANRPRVPDTVIRPGDAAADANKSAAKGSVDPAKASNNNSIATAQPQPAKAGSTTREAATDFKPAGTADGRSTAVVEPQPAKPSGDKSAATAELQNAVAADARKMVSADFNERMSALLKKSGMAETLGAIRQAGSELAGSVQSMALFTKREGGEMIGGMSAANPSAVSNAKLVEAQANKQQAV